MELVAREKFCVIFWSDLTFSAQGLVFSQQCSWKLGIYCCVIGWMSFPLDFLTLKMFLQNGRNRSPRDTSACPRSPRYACFFDCMIYHFAMCCVLVFDNFDTTTHPVFTKFYVDECCEVDFTLSAQQGKQCFVTSVFQFTRYTFPMMVVAATETCRNIEWFCSNFLKSLNIWCILLENFRQELNTGRV